jgi:UDP-N-acetylmuramoylalanine--D-glutamate ligase
VEGVKKGIPVTSEIELAFRYVREPIIAVTGTNGKTTTTKLIGEIFKAWGKTVFIGGNIGTPLIEYVDEGGGADYVLLEVSSFQLQWVDHFRPSVAMLLNMTVDHLDYHKSFDEYLSIKKKIFARQRGDDLAILNADDPSFARIAPGIGADMVAFSSSGKRERGIYIDGSLVCYREGEGMREDYPIDGITIKGVHNLENAMAAIVAARKCGCPRDVITRTLKDFHGLPHRIEFVRSKNHVDIYNDSKGTNVDAVKRALESFSRPVVLLMGGRDKGGDFDILAPLIQKKVKQVVLFGEARHRIGSLIDGIVDVAWADHLREALDAAWKSSCPGDVILLSPGCSSFDEFANYRERGNYFKEMVARL